MELEHMFMPYTKVNSKRLQIFEKDMTPWNLYKEA